MHWPEFYMNGRKFHRPGQMVFLVLLAPFCLALSPQFASLKTKSGLFKHEYFDNLDMSGENAYHELADFLGTDGFGDRKDIQEALKQSSIPFECLHMAYSGVITKNNEGFLSKTCDHFKEKAVKFIALDFTFTKNPPSLSPVLSPDERLRAMGEWAIPVSVIQLGLAIFYANDQKPRKISVLVQPSPTSRLGEQFLGSDDHLMDVFMTAYRQGISVEQLLQLVLWLNASKKPLVFYDASGDFPFLAGKIDRTLFSSLPAYKSCIEKYFFSFSDAKLLAEMLPTPGIDNSSLENFAKSLGVLDGQDGNFNDADYNALITGLAFISWLEMQNCRRVECAHIRNKYRNCFWDNGSTFRCHCVSDTNNDDLEKPGTNKEEDDSHRQGQEGISLSAETAVKMSETATTSASFNSASSSTFANSLQNLILLLAYVMLA